MIGSYWFIGAHWYLLVVIGFGMISSMDETDPGNQGSKEARQLLSGKGESPKVLSRGILLLAISLIVASLYLLTRLKSGIKTKPQYSPNETEEKALDASSIKNWRTYRNENYGYLVDYPPLLVPREVESDIYLSFVIFLATEGISNSGFAISVRETQLGEETGLIKDEIEKDVSGELIREEATTKDGISGARLEFEPETREVAEPRTVVILNNGRFSYTISAHPNQIDQILSTFKLTE